MGLPVVHFEIIGRDPGKLRGYYSRLFGWEFDTNSPVAPSVSGTASVGSTLTVANGSWTNAPPGYQYTWFRCSGGSSRWRWLLRPSSDWWWIRWYS